MHTARLRSTRAHTSSMRVFEQQEASMREAEVLTARKRDGFHMTPPLVLCRAHGHNFHMCCYVLSHIVTGENLGETLHPSIMGCVLLACDARLNDRYSCRICRDMKGGGKGGRTHFRTPFECIDQLHRPIRGDKYSQYPGYS
eukprot:5411696-Amphidinium_carterae.2